MEVIGTFDFRLLCVWITTDNELIPFLFQMFARDVSGILNTILHGTQYTKFYFKVLDFVIVNVSDKNRKKTILKTFLIR